eukprot:763382-Hanusia_phi.AAC.2
MSSSLARSIPTSSPSSRVRLQLSSPQQEQHPKRPRVSVVQAGMGIGGMGIGGLGVPGVRQNSEQLRERREEDEGEISRRLLVLVSPSPPRLLFVPFIRSPADSAPRASGQRQLVMMAVETSRPSCYEQARTDDQRRIVS